MGAAPNYITSAVPTITRFNPHDVPWQWTVIQDIENFDYSLGKHELLFSGSVGSAKSILAAHIAVTHCLRFAGARVCLARRSMPDLKDTIFKEVLEHIGEDLVEGKDFWVNQTKAYIRFENGSEIISRSWADRKSKKGRSLRLSMLIIEEAAENDDQDRLAIEELSMRVGRLPYIPHQLVLFLTNPDSPGHWLYKHFFGVNSPTRHIYYSLTRDNKFLPKSYIDQLHRDLDPKMAQRMLEGKWIEISGEVIYYAYDKEIHFKNHAYEINLNFPIHMSFDFNIADGKPMSAVFFQFINDHFHFYEECVVEGARTESLMEEAEERGLLHHPTLYIINGDATGKSKAPQAKGSNYDVIKQYLSRVEIIEKIEGKPDQIRLVQFEIQVPKTNPPIRARHNRVNAYFKNVLDEIRISVYSTCPVLDEGLRLTKLKKGAQYLEDDSKSFQHVTTAAGYGIMECLRDVGRKPQGTVQL